jgi:protein required for attachment to host cells
MNTTWLLVADGARARLFEVAAPSPALTELGCYTNPDERAGARAMTSEHLPTVNESVGPARHSIEPHTTPREKVIDRFARSLGDVLERGHNEHRYGRLILVAPPKFLGALHKVLNKTVRNAVGLEIKHDFTALRADEILARLPTQARH